MAEQLNTRALVFKGHGIVGRLFTSNPWVAATITSALALLCLNLPAGLLGEGHVFDQQHKDVGYFAKFNWSLVYPVFAPVFVGLCILAFQKMRMSVYQLIEKSNRRIPVIKDDHDGVAEDYPNYLSTELAAWAGWIEALAAVAAFAITAVDTADLWPGFINGGKFPDSRVPEWDTAFRIPDAHMYGHIIANGVFDIVAYSFQTLLIFLGLFFLIKYWAFLRIMVQIIDRNRPPYRFVPWPGDGYRRLGLQPLGWVFNLFLVIIVLYQIFAFYHRIELIDSYHKDASGTYINSVREEVLKHKDEHMSAQAMALLLLPQKYYAWDSLANPSSWLPLLFSLPPILLVCVLPIGRLFWYLRAEVKELTETTSVALTEAKTTEDKELAEKMESRLKNLRETTIWPNGSVAGSVFLILMVALLVGTVCPPFLILGITSGIILKLIWSVLGGTGRGGK